MPLMWVSAWDTAGLSQEERCLVNDTTTSVTEIPGAALQSWDCCPLLNFKKSSFWRQHSRSQLLRFFAHQSILLSVLLKITTKHKSPVQERIRGHKILPNVYKGKSTKSHSLNFKNVIFGKYFLLYNTLLRMSSACGFICEYMKHGTM